MIKRREGVMEVGDGDWSRAGGWARASGASPTDDSTFIPGWMARISSMVDILFAPLGGCFLLGRAPAILDIILSYKIDK